MLYFLLVGAMQVLMSLDRYLAIVHPVISRSLRTQRNTVVVVGFLWLVVSVANGPLLSHHDVVYYCFDNRPHSACINVNIYLDATKSVGRVFYGCFFAFAFFFPLSVISLLYGRLLLHLRNRARRAATSAALVQLQRRYARTILDNTHAHTYVCIGYNMVYSWLWSPYVIGQTIIFSSCGFFLLLSSFFIPRLISVVGDWMSAILPHMVWP